MGLRDNMFLKKNRDFMPTQPPSYSIEDLVEKTRSYLETQLALTRYKAIDKSSDIISSLSVYIFFVLVLFLFLITINIGIAFWIGGLLGQNFYGFFITGAFDALVGLVIFLFRNKWIKAPISRLIIDKAIT